ncbi:hypothetical protein [Aggregatibacter segnis]|nr:hypothetical protein [Aggregatibacter segnis]
MQKSIDMFLDLLVALPSLVIGLSLLPLFDSQSLLSQLILNVN